MKTLTDGQLIFIQEQELITRLHMRNTMISTEELQLPETEECNKWPSKHLSSQMLVEEMNQLLHTAHNTTQETDLTIQLITKKNGSISWLTHQLNTESFPNIMVHYLR